MDSLKHHNFEGTINQHVIMIICIIGMCRADAKSNENQIRIFEAYFSFCCARPNFDFNIIIHLCFTEIALHFSSPYHEKLSIKDMKVRRIKQTKFRSLNLSL